MDIREACGKILDISVKLTAAGAIGAFEGNISCRVGDKVVITPSGKSKVDLKADELSILDMEGNWIGGPFKPSSEGRMHLAIYRMRDDVNAVVHTHSPYATAFAMANRSIDLRCSAEFAIFFKHVPVIPYGTPGTDDIYKGMDKELELYDTLLLQNHGLVTVGKTLDDAYSKCSTLELTLRTYSISKSLFPDGICDLPQAELEKLWEMGSSKRGRQA